MKIKMIKVYQAVEFEGNSVSYFTPKEWYEASLTIRTNAPQVVIEELPEGFLIRSEKDIVKVLNANIAYIKYYEPKEVKELKKAK